MDKIEEKIVEYLMTYPNVVGVSKKLKKKIVGGEETEELAIRVYVTKKKPLEKLHPKHVIPRRIGYYKTDVVEIGEVYALSVLPLALKPEKTERIRPVQFGISIGHAQITAGTNGWAYEKDGKIFFGSNAHVFTPDPSLEPKQIIERHILQPGPYDGGKFPEDIVAEYYWHKQIKPEVKISDCKVARFTVKVLNGICKLFNRKTRFVPIVYGEKNYMDFSVAIPTVEYELKLFDMDTAGKKLAGHIFAGSDKVGIFFKIKYVLREGYKPVCVVPAPDTKIKVGKTVEKTGRTTCHSQAKIIDDSATVRVNYLTFIALFDDVVITDNPDKKFVQGGDSGSSVWLVEK